MRNNEIDIIRATLQECIALLRQAHQRVRERHPKLFDDKKAPSEGE